MKKTKVIKKPVDNLKSQEVRSNRMSLQECAKDMGYDYEHFLTIYTKLFSKNDVKIIKIPGLRKVWVDRRSYERMFEANVIN